MRVKEEEHIHPTHPPTSHTPSTHQQLTLFYIVIQFYIHKCHAHTARGLEKITWSLIVQQISINSTSNDRFCEA